MPGPQQPLLRILPGAPVRVYPASTPIRVSDGVQCFSAPDGGAMLTFAPGAGIRWESADLLSRPAGSLVLDFAYSAESYHKDEPVLQVTDAQGETVLRVTIGRVMFKVERPPYAFAIDLYLHEREGRWLRPVLTWERLDAERQYLRVTVNDRPYDRTIVHPFPPGPLAFFIGPDSAPVREAAFYPRPIPKAPHPHINGDSSSWPEHDVLRRRAFVSETDQAALDGRGGVLVYMPDGAPMEALPGGLRTMGLRFRTVNAADLATALPGAAALVLPDVDHWPLDLARETAIGKYVRSGGGLLALGMSALEVRRMGLAQFEQIETGIDGRVSVLLRSDSAVLPAALGQWFAPNVMIDSLSRRGPQYDVPESRRGEIVATLGLTGRPCILAASCERGRVVLASVFPFGYYFGRPRFETVGNAERQSLPYLLFKTLLFHAAGVEMDTAAEPGPLTCPIAIPAARALRTRDGRLTMRRGRARLGSIAAEPSGAVRAEAVELHETASMRFGGLQIGATGAAGFWFQADTLNLRGAQPRNLLCLSDGGENLLQLYYDPRDQHLILSIRTPNEEERTAAVERTTWNGRDWRHVGFTWQATKTGDAAVELFIDGRRAACGGMPLPTASWSRLILGATPGMTGLAMAVRDLALSRRPLLDLESIQSKAAPPISWADTPEEVAELLSFQRAHKLALLAENHPQMYRGMKTYDVYGLSFDVLYEREIADGALEKNGYSVLYAPGGGLPAFQEPAAMQEKIRAFVRQGGGYLGICAGMNEASSMGAPNETAALFATPTAIFGGTDLVDVQLAGGHPALRDVPAAFRGAAPAVRFVHMSGSPLRMETPDADVTPVAWLSAAAHLAAAGSFHYGKGRGIVWCPHPELAGWGWWKPSDRTHHVMRKLFRNSIRFAAGFLPVDPALTPPRSPATL